MSDKNKILYVDDEEINLFLFEKRFERDFDLVTASSGDEALQVLQNEESCIRIVISDMRMPEMDGLQFIDTAQQRFNDITYFILTGYEFNPELEKALNNRLINNLFKKPFDFDELSQAIQNEIRKN